MKYVMSQMISVGIYPDDMLMNAIFGRTQRVVLLHTGDLPVRSSLEDPGRRRKKEEKLK